MLYSSTGVLNLIVLVILVYLPGYAQECTPVLYYSHGAYPHHPTLRVYVYTRIPVFYPTKDALAKFRSERRELT